MVGQRSTIWKKCFHLKVENTNHFFVSGRKKVENMGRNSRWTTCFPRSCLCPKELLTYK